MRRALLPLLLLAAIVPGPVSGQRAMRQNLRDARQGAGKLRAELRENQTASRDTKIQLARVTERVNVATARLGQTKRNLSTETVRAGRLAAELARTQVRVAERRAAVRRRLRAIYVGGEARPISVFLGAQSAGDLASRAYLLERIARRDRAMYEDLRRWTVYARSRKAQSDASVLRLRDLTNEQTQRGRELTGAQAAKRDLLSRLNDRRGQVESALAQFEEDERRIADAIAAYETRLRAEAAARRARIAKRKKEAARRAAEYARRAAEARKRGRKAPPPPHEAPPEQGEGPDPDRPPGRFGRPTGGPITSGFGMRMHPILHRMRNHDGIDFGGGFGAPVSAAADGVVIAATAMRGYGQVIIIDHGGGYSTVYGHLSQFAVNAGTRVRRGQRIGAIGNSGLSTGPHLHFEVHINGRKVDPRGYL